MEAESPPSMATGQPLELGKLFVGGTSLATGSEDLRTHFEAFGEVSEAVAIRDRETGNLRGFGFVLFADPATASIALNQPEHVILGRKVEVKRATPRGDRHRSTQAAHYQYPKQSPQQNGGSSASNTNLINAGEFKWKKIFVGGLPPGITQEEFRQYFVKFGAITDVVVMHDPLTRRTRGFGFITFESEESVNSVLQKSHHELNGKLVEVKIAIPKDYGSNQSSRNNNSRLIGGRSLSPCSYQDGNHPTFGPAYAFYPHHCYGPVFSTYGYGASGYFGIYYIASYPGMGYGVSFGAPRNHRRIPVPYTNTMTFAGYRGYGGTNYGSCTNSNFVDNMSDLWVSDVDVNRQRISNVSPETSDSRQCISC